MKTVGKLLLILITTTLIFLPFASGKGVLPNHVDFNAIAHFLYSWLKNLMVMFKTLYSNIMTVGGK